MSNLKKDDYNSNNPKSKKSKFSLIWKVIICLLLVAFVCILFLLPFIGVISIVINLIILLILISIKKVREYLKGSFSLTPLRKVKTYLYILIALISIRFISETMDRILGYEGTQVHTFLNYWWDIGLYVIALAIISPIWEEVIFRGIVFRYLQDKYNFWIALIASSLLFGLLHIGYPIEAIIVGMIFVWLYKISKSLVVPILAHILVNLITAIVIYL